MVPDGFFAKVLFIFASLWFWVIEHKTWTFLGAVNATFGIIGFVWVACYIYQHIHISIN